MKAQGWTVEWLLHALAVPKQGVVEGRVRALCLRLVAHIAGLCDVVNPSLSVLLLETARAMLLERVICVSVNALLQQDDVFLHCMHIAELFPSPRVHEKGGASASHHRIFLLSPTCTIIIHKDYIGAVLPWRRVTGRVVSVVRTDPYNIGDTDKWRRVVQCFGYAATHLVDQVDADYDRPNIGDHSRAKRALCIWSGARDDVELSAHRKPAR